MPIHEKYLRQKERNRAEGVCISCLAKPPLATKTRCARCGDLVRQGAARQLKRTIKKGLCRGCRKCRPAKNRIRCLACLRARRKVIPAK